MLASLYRSRQLFNKILPTFWSNPHWLRKYFNILSTEHGEGMQNTLLLIKFIK